jgi:hypothetical protein
MLKRIYKGLLLSVILLGLLVLDVNPAFAQATPGAKSTTQVALSSSDGARTFQGGVVRGDRVTYAVSGKQGQDLSLNLTSLENNAVFDVVDPSGKVIKSEATSWLGSLSTKGNYKVIVGGTRGNASYTLMLAQVSPDYQNEVKMNTTCGFINADDVNLRQEPSTKATVITQFKRGDGVRVPGIDSGGSNNGWVRIVARDSGKPPTPFSPVSGYVSNQYINGCSEDQFDRWRK